MENLQQKWVNLSYLALAALVAFVVFSLGVKISSTWDMEARVKNLELILRVVSLVLGALVFWILSRNDNVNQFMNEVVVELSRVTWPTQRETSSATLVVMIMVLISGMVLGFLDYVWTNVVKWIV